MTEADRESFALEMALMAEVFGEPLSEARLEIYFSDLAGYDIEHVRQGLRLARQSKRFFPRLADVIECIEDAVEARVQRHAREARALGAGVVARWKEIAPSRLTLALPQGNRE